MLQQLRRSTYAFVIALVVPARSGVVPPGTGHKLDVIGHSRRIDLLASVQASSRRVSGTVNQIEDRQGHN